MVLTKKIPPKWNYFLNIEFKTLNLLHNTTVKRANIAPITSATKSKKSPDLVVVYSCCINSIPIPKNKENKKE